MIMNNIVKVLIVEANITQNSEQKIPQVFRQNDERASSVKNILYMKVCNFVCFITSTKYGQEINENQLDTIHRALHGGRCQ